MHLAQSVAMTSAYADVAQRDVSSWLLVGCGFWLVALGFYFIAVRPPLLPEDARFMDTSVSQIRAAVPGLDGWLKKVFTVMGGFIVGTGVLTVCVAWAGVSSRGTSWALALAGVLTVGLMSATNFVLRSDFRWVLLIPAAVWAAALILLVARSI